jgi:transcription initiation factor IIE alpha subunit
MNSLSYSIDRYVVDTLMRDLVGHDRRPSAFLVYLALSTAARGGTVAMSHAELAERTGLSKRAVQMAVALLRDRGLLRLARRGETDALTVQPLTPWRR